MSIIPGPRIIRFLGLGKIHIKWIFSLSEYSLNANLFNYLFKSQSFFSYFLFFCTFSLYDRGHVLRIQLIMVFWICTCTCLRCRCSSIGSSSVMNMMVNVVSICCSSQGKMARIRICRKIITVGRSEFCHTKIIEILPENIKITKIYHTVPKLKSLKTLIYRIVGKNIRKIITVGCSKFCHTKIIEILPEKYKNNKNISHWTKIEKFKKHWYIYRIVGKNIRKIITVGCSKFCHTKIIEILPEKYKNNKNISHWTKIEKFKKHWYIYRIVGKNIRKIITVGCSEFCHNQKLKLMQKCCRFSKLVTLFNFIIFVYKLPR